MQTTLALRAGIAVALIYALCGCGPHFNLPPDAHFATGFDTSVPPSPVSLPDDIPIRSVMLKSLGVPKMPKNSVIGGIGVGGNCTLAGTLRMTFPDQAQKPTIAWKREFYKVLTSAHFKVMGNPDETFEDEAQLRPDLMLSATIAGQKRNDCYSGNVPLITLPHTTEFEEQVIWEVFDVALHRVVLTVTTTGYWKGEPSSDPSQTNVYTKAIENNIKMLAADEQFRTLVLAHGSHPRPPSGNRAKPRSEGI